MGNRFDELDGLPSRFTQEKVRFKIHFYAQHNGVKFGRRLPLNIKMHLKIRYNHYALFSREKT